MGVFNHVLYLGDYAYFVKILGLWVLSGNILLRHKQNTGVMHCCSGSKRLERNGTHDFYVKLHGRKRNKASEGNQG